MELPGLANLKRNTLRGIASLTERPSKNKAERSEAKRLGMDSPARRARRSEMAGRGPCHRRPPLRLAAILAIDKAITKNQDRSHNKSCMGRSQCCRVKIIFLLVHIDHLAMPDVQLDVAAISRRTRHRVTIPEAQNNAPYCREYGTSKENLDDPLQSHLSWWQEITSSHRLHGYQNYHLHPQNHCRRSQIERSG